MVTMVWVVGRNWV